jgi:heme oxygenase|tara:strand:- start:1298 stop:1570 length:273 start_codon:yes stop_codon:yes gene_type:complete
MAKNKKKTELPTHIQPSELTKMKELVGQTNNGHLQLGQLSMRKHKILHALAKIQDEITLFQESIEKAYGKCEVNVDDGEIKYISDEQADS